jgi:DNA (cytosine-5)-methyltransferase 1
LQQNQGFGKSRLTTGAACAAKPVMRNEYKPADAVPGSGVQIAIIGPKGGCLGLHPDPAMFPVTAGEALVGCRTAQNHLGKLSEAAAKYRAYKHWDRIRIGGSKRPITGQGFNAAKFDPRKPARTIRRNAGDLGMHGAMHWAARRRFSLAEFKRFGSFPDGFAFAGPFDEGIRQIGNSVPPLFMRAIAGHIRREVLGQAA